MTRLPAPLVDPLHVLPTWILFVLVVMMAAGFMILCARYWLRRRSATSVRAPAQQSDLAASRVSTFLGVIEALRARTLARGAFRQGCHQLAAEVRAYLERKKGFEAEEMTATEIAAWSADGRVGRYMRELRSHQFSRQGPTKDDFLRACQRAETLFR